MARATVLRGATPLMRELADTRQLDARQLAGASDGGGAAAQLVRIGWAQYPARAARMSALLPPTVCAGTATGRFEGRGPSSNWCATHWPALCARAGADILSDASFEDWPLGGAVAEPLQAWSRTGRRMTLLAPPMTMSSGGMRVFVSWRRTWAHIIEAGLPPMPIRWSAQRHLEPPG